MQACGKLEIYIRFCSDFLGSKCKAVFTLTSFNNSSAQFLSMSGILTLVSYSIVVVSLLVFVSLLESFVIASANFRVFSPLLMF